MPGCVPLGHATVYDLVVTIILPVWFTPMYKRGNRGSEEFEDLPTVSQSGQWSRWTPMTFAARSSVMTKINEHDNPGPLLSMRRALGTLGFAPSSFNTRNSPGSWRCFYSLCVRSGDMEAQ